MRVDDDWASTTLGEVVNLKRGYDLPERDRTPGPFPIVSSSGVTGTHAEAKRQPPGVVTGRYGTLGSVHYTTEPYWPLNTTLYVQDFKGNHPRFVSYLLEMLDLGELVASAAVPGINRNHLHPLRVRVPDSERQRMIAGALGAFDDLFENNRRRFPGCHTRGGRRIAGRSLGRRRGPQDHGNEPQYEDRGSAEADRHGGASCTPVVAGDLQA